MKELVHLLNIVAIVLLTLSCKRTLKNKSKVVEDKVKSELYIEPYAPFVETLSCKFYCNQDSADMLIDQGYILSGASFNPNENISYGETLPFSPKKGNKDILFIHFQPDFQKNGNGDCPSSNLVLFLELESLQNNEITEVSRNIQFALFTGGPFYRFETKGETKGEIQINNEGDRIVAIKLKLEFEIMEENITSLELDSRLTIINQETVD